jgi:nitrogen regulatory protein PII
MPGGACAADTRLVHAKGEVSSTMKMLVAYVDPQRFEPIREELLAQGFLSFSVNEASGSIPEATTSAAYRGVSVQRHTRAKIRLECVVGAEHVASLRDTIIKHAPDHSFVFVVPVEEAYPTTTVKHDEAAAVT